MPILNEGATAPNFTLETDQGVISHAFGAPGQATRLVLYPKDDTPGCTIECKEFRDARAQFEG